MTNKQYNTNLNSYNESEALQQLLRTTFDALNAETERIEADASDAWQEQFTITVGGVQTAFILGGPQVEALVAFIQHIAGENLYSVDIDKRIVEG